MAILTRGKSGGARPGARPKPKPAEERRRNRLVLNLRDRELEAIERAARVSQLLTLLERSCSVIWRGAGRDPAGEALLRFYTTRLRREARATSPVTTRKPVPGSGSTAIHPSPLPLGSVPRPTIV